MEMKGIHWTAASTSDGCGDRVASISRGCPKRVTKLARGEGRGWARCDCVYRRVYGPVDSFRGTLDERVSRTDN